MLRRRFPDATPPRLNPNTSLSFCASRVDMKLVESAYSTRQSQHTLRAAEMLVNSSDDKHGGLASSDGLFSTRALRIFILKQVVQHRYRNSPGSSALRESLAPVNVIQYSPW